MDTGGDDAKSFRLNEDGDMTQVDEALLRWMVSAIVDAADPEQVILFGSRARGDTRADSDIDLVVVEADYWRHSLNHVLARAARRQGAL